MKVGGKLKAEQICQTGAQIVATPCANCKKQLKELVEHYEIPCKVMGLHDLILRAIEIPGAKSPQERKEEAERQRLAAIKAAMTDEDRSRVVRQAAELALRQQQEDDPEMVRIRPVEGRPLNDQYLLLQQQVEHHFFIIVDLVDLGIHARKKVHRAPGFDAADAGNIGQEVVGKIALPAQAAARRDQVLDALIAAERGLYGMLPRHI